MSTSPGPDERAILNPVSTKEQEDWVALRRGLLLIEREDTRVQGQRKLERIVERFDPQTSPVAMGGLAASCFWSGDLSKAMAWGRQTIARYPLSPSAVWAADLLISIFHMTGMKREHFETQHERMNLLKKIAFHGTERADRIYALEELVTELKSRSLVVEARRCSEELKSLHRPALSRRTQA